jgi:hypothetical protein
LEKALYHTNQSAVNNTILSNISMSFPETTYFTHLPHLSGWINTSTAQVFSAAWRCLGGEGAGDGWTTMHNSIHRATEVFAGPFQLGCNNFKRIPNETESYQSRLNDIKTNRSLIIGSNLNAGISIALRLSIAYHTQTFTLSGNITGSAGGTVNIKLLDLTENKILLTTSRIGNGSYSFTVPNPVEQYIVLAYETDTLKGSSKQDTYNTDFDINLASSGGSEAPKSYAFIG